eukprot:8908458-Pyramimonas_sp.AAC.1
MVDPWRWDPENNVWACFRNFKRLFSDEAVPSVEMNRRRSLWRGSLEGGFIPTSLMTLGPLL